MNLVSLLSEEGMPRSLLYAAAEECLLQPSLAQTASEPQDVDLALGRLASASLLTFSVDDSTVTAHRLTMRVTLERQAQEGSLAVLGAGVAELLLTVSKSLGQPWRNRPAARDAMQQVVALDEHLKPYVGDQEADVALTGTLLSLRNWVVGCLNDLGDNFALAHRIWPDAGPRL